jgi:hypothetical protein
MIVRSRTLDYIDEAVAAMNKLILHLMKTGQLNAPEGEPLKDRLARSCVDVDYQVNSLQDALRRKIVSDAFPNMSEDMIDHAVEKIFVA